MRDGRSCALTPMAIASGGLRPRHERLAAEMLDETLGGHLAVLGVEERATQSGRRQAFPSHGERRQSPMRRSWNAARRLVRALMAHRAVHHGHAGILGAALRIEEVKMAVVALAREASIGVTVEATGRGQYGDHAREQGFPIARFSTPHSVDGAGGGDERPSEDGAGRRISADPDVMNSQLSSAAARSRARQRAARLPPGSSERRRNTAPRNRQSTAPWPRDTRGADRAR